MYHWGEAQPVIKIMECSLTVTTTCSVVIAVEAKAITEVVKLQFGCGRECSLEPQHRESN